MSNSSVSTDAVTSFVQYWTETYWDQRGDPRIKHLPLMSSLRPLLAILLLYALFVKVLGPLMMRKRDPLSLKPILIVYNLVMSLLNGYFFFRFLSLYDFGLGVLNVQQPPFSPLSIFGSGSSSGGDVGDLVVTRIEVAYLYELSKIVDLLDTVFFVLRKKYSQVTWLHFYHHFSVPVIGWLYIRLSGDNVVLVQFAIFNSVIHFIMYAYYGLAAIGPKMQPYLWWKRYITQIQIVQFIIMFAYTAYFALYQSGYHLVYTVNQFIQSSLYTYLFTRFYFVTYKKEDGGKEGGDKKMKKN